jgi:hypothetical protein
MALECIKCKKELNRINNYGQKDMPLCYDCVNDLSCAECLCKISVSEQITHNNRMLCRKCYEKIIKINNSDFEIHPIESNENKPYIPAFSSNDEVEKFFYENYKIKVNLRIFLIISACLLFPFFGGIKDLIITPLNNLDALHIICFLVYIIYLFGLLRLILRKIIPSKNGLIVVNWFSTKYHSFDEIEKIYENEYPEHDMAHQKFAIYKTYLYIYSKSGKSVLKEELVKNYQILKSIIEYKLGKNIPHFRKEKSGLKKFFEWV